MAECIEVPPDELSTLVDQINANPPAGLITLDTDSEGRLIATWQHTDGMNCSFGPTITVDTRKEPL
jgi:hypothetical protein